MSTRKTMRAWQIPVGCTSVDQLALIDLPMPVPGPGEVLIRVHANSLNYRDQAIPRGQYFGGPVAVAGIPLSDGAGVVEGVGRGVMRVAPGDRVAINGILRTIQRVTAGVKGTLFDIYL